MRSAVCIAVFFLLDCRRASAHERGPLVLAAAATHFPDFFRQVIHTSWLGPGLIVGALLILLALVTSPGDKPKKKNGLVRKFRTPKLERFRGEYPKNHRDLEV